MVKEDYDYCERLGDFMVYYSRSARGWGVKWRGDNSGGFHIHDFPTLARARNAIRKHLGIK